jgi:tRNA nucleotidyltransferase (CCA-adding enzyme)
MSEFGAVGVGKSFFVYRYENIDISLPRSEKKVSFGHRGFEVKLVQDKKEASKRRDFTINAMMISLKSGELLDFFGGFRDLEKKILRVVDKKSFVEDSLRVLRAMQFSARFGFRIEKNSALLMKKMDLSDLSKERVFNEFEKMFFANYLHYGLYYLFYLDIATKIFGLNKEISFIKTALHLQKAKSGFDKGLREFYFLYILAKFCQVDLEFFIKKLNLPNRYKKIYKFQSFVYEIKKEDIFLKSLKVPIKLWLENYNPYVKKVATKCGLYEKKFSPKIKAQELIEMGYEGAEISKKLKEISLKEIKEYMESRCKDI